VVGRNKGSGQCPVEGMSIGDVRRLALALGIPVIELLNASIGLSENITKGQLQGPRELPKLYNTNIALTG